MNNRYQLAEMDVEDWGHIVSGEPVSLERCIWDLMRLDSNPLCEVHFYVVEWRGEWSTCEHWRAIEVAMGRTEVCSQVEAW